MLSEEGTDADEERENNKGEMEEYWPPVFDDRKHPEAKFRTEISL